MVYMRSEVLNAVKLYIRTDQFQPPQHIIRKESPMGQKESMFDCVLSEKWYVIDSRHVIC